MRKLLKILSLVAAVSLLSANFALADNVPDEPRLVTSFTYDAALTPSEGLCAVKQNGKWGFVTCFGSTACDFIYDGCLPFSEGAAAVCQNGKWGFLTATADITSETTGGCRLTVVGGFNWEAAGSFSEGLCPVKQSGKWGFVDDSFSLVIPCVYDMITDFSGGYAAVMLSGKWGAVSASGDVTIEPKYADMSAFSDGIAAFCDTKYGAILGSGYVLIEPVWSSVQVSESGITLCDAAKGVWAVADRTGQIVRDSSWKNVGRFYDPGGKHPGFCRGS
jgi:hypothetical protein